MEVLGEFVQKVNILKLPVSERVIICNTRWFLRTSPEKSKHYFYHYFLLYQLYELVMSETRQDNNLMNLFAAVFKASPLDIHCCHGYIYIAWILFRRFWLRGADIVRNIEHWNIHYSRTGFSCFFSVQVFQLIFYSPPPQ